MFFVEKFFAEVILSKTFRRKTFRRKGITSKNISSKDILSKRHFAECTFRRKGISSKNISSKRSHYSVPSVSIALLCRAHLRRPVCRVEDKMSKYRISFQHDFRNAESRYESRCQSTHTLVVPSGSRFQNTLKR